MTNLGVWTVLLILLVITMLLYCGKLWKLWN